MFLRSCTMKLVEHCSLCFPPVCCRSKVTVKHKVISTCDHNLVTIILDFCFGLLIINGNSISITLYFGIMFIIVVIRIITDHIKLPTFSVSSKTFTHWRKEGLIHSDVWSRITGAYIYPSVHCTNTREKSCNNHCELY